MCNRHLISDFLFPQYVHFYIVHVYNYAHDTVLDYPQISLRKPRIHSMHVCIFDDSFQPVRKSQLIM